MPTPKIQFDPSAWLTDASLNSCSLATQGAWMRIICAMQCNGRTGELTGTAEELAAKVGCMGVDFEPVITELDRSGAADVQRLTGDETCVVRNRRMFRESQKRNAAAERQKTHRKLVSNAEIKQDVEASFEEFWSVFPPKRRTAKGEARVAFAKAVQKADAQVIIAAAREYAASEKAQTRFVKGPAPWLNQECWNDDRAAWRDLDRPQPVVAAYRKIPLAEFKALGAADKFVPRAYADAENESGYKRVFGTLNNGSKVESHTDPNWKP